MMKNIAILTGGDSAEYRISIQSANTVLEHLNPKLFKGYIVHLKDGKFSVLINDETLKINEVDFSFNYNKEHIKFNSVFMALHGPPAENGDIQPYFDNLNIPYTSCNAEVSALTFNKYECNNKLRDLGFNCAASYSYKKGTIIDTDLILKKVGLPCFVKPNGSGSSFGVSKVTQNEALIEAINNALIHDDTVLIEQFIDGIEVSCGVYYNNKEVKALPITEIVTENDFFDFEAKYEGKSEEITPARISASLTSSIQNTTKDIYKKMQLSGTCRIDYIIMNDQAYIIEINTIPGLSEESIIPKQIKAANLKLSEIFELCLLNTNN